MHHIAIVKQEEGLVDGLPATPGLDPYLCPSGYATIGWGHVVLHPQTGKQLWGASGLAIAQKLYPNGISHAEATVLLDRDLDRFEVAVDRCGAKLTANQRSAFIPLAFNIGEAAFASSSAVKMARGKHHDQVPDCIRRWNKARKFPGGPLKVERGLVIRREIEARLYATPDGAPFDPLAIRREMEIKLGIRQ